MEDGGLSSCRRGRFTFGACQGSLAKLGRKEAARVPLVAVSLTTILQTPKSSIAQLPFVFSIGACMLFSGNAVVAVYLMHRGTEIVTQYMNKGLSSMYGAGDSCRPFQRDTLMSYHSILCRFPEYQLINLFSASLYEFLQCHNTMLDLED